MKVRKIEIERFSATSSKPFAEVVAAIKASVGQPDMAEFAKATRGTGSFAQLERTVQAGLGKTGLMLFMELDHGAILRKETGNDTPKIVRLLIGNPLIMKEMAKHVPDAGSYAPVTILVDERPEGVRLSYDRMASFLAPYVNALSPGPINTPAYDRMAQSGAAGQQMLASIVNRVPMGRFGAPDEIAGAAVFLASDDSTFVTGTELFVDGGAAQI